MSAKVFGLVLDYPFTHTQKAVMLALANQCNDFGQHCFPSFALIERHTSLGRRTIFDALGQLEDQGYLTRVRIPRSQRVEFVIHVDRLLQAELPGLEPEDPAGRRARRASAGAASVREPHQDQPEHAEPRGNAGSGVGAVRAECGSRTGAQNRETGAGDAPTGAGAALHKAPVIYPTAPDISPGSGREDLVGSFEGHDDPLPEPAPAPTTAGAIAVELRRRGYRLTSTDPNLLAAVAEGVTLAQVTEFAEIYPASHAKCRGSPGYVLSACRRQRAERAESVEPAPQGKPHATGHRQRASSSDRIVEHIVRARRGDDPTLDAEGFRIIG